MRFIVAAVAAALFAPSSGAQQAISLSGASPKSDLSAFLQTIGVSDVFMGRNTVGPYLLTWKKIEGESEIISRGAKRLARGTDYTLDPATGVLTFTAPLRAREIARVDYRYNPKTAAANNGSILPPVQLNLFDLANGAVTFNALLKPGVDAGGQKPAGNMMLLAMGSTAKLAAGSSLSSKIVFDAMGGNVLSRSGMQLKEETAARYGKFSAGITRAGAEFKASEEGGITAGKQIIDLNGALNPIHGITASASFQQTTELPATGKGATVAVLTQRLGGTLGARTRFTASHSETTASTADNPDVVRTANRLQIDHKIDGKTQATALFEQNGSQTGDSKTLTQGTTLVVRSQPTEKVSLQGTFANRLSAAGPEDTDSIKVSADATSRLKLTATLGDRYSTKSALRTREATFDYAPVQQLSLTGLFQSRTEAKEVTVARGITAKVKPASFFEVSGGAKVREAVTDGTPDPLAPDTYDVRVAVSLPNKTIRLSGGYTYNPEDDRGAVTRSKNRNIAVQSTLGAFDLGGGYTLQEELMSTKVNSIFDLQFGWRLAKDTQLSTTFRQAQTLETSLLSTDTYGLRFTHRIGSLLDLMLSGTMTQYLQNGAELQRPDYRAEAKVGIRF